MHDSESCSTKRQTLYTHIALVKNLRTVNTEAFILSFAVENSLKIHSLRDGLSYNHKELMNKINKYPFSINMDECTSHMSKCVFPILVSYFDEVKVDSVVEHFQSIECIVVNAKTLFKKIARLFLRDNITWDNLV